MATWQELYEMLLDEDLSPEKVVARLNVRPSRLRQLLASKRLAARLKAVETVADRKAVHTFISRIAHVAGRLVKLVESGRPETARRACLDVIATARQVHKSRSDEEQRDRLNRWNDSRWDVSAEAPDVRRRTSGAGESGQAPAASAGCDGSAAAGAGQGPAPAGAGEAAPTAAPPAGPSMTRKAAAALAKRKGRPTGPSVEAVMADAERRRRFREQIASHGGAAMARLYQRGR